MSEVVGAVGAIYYQKATKTATTIALVDSSPDTITDSGSGFVTAGFEADDKITISGSTSDDGTYTASVVAAGTITLITADALTGQAAGTSLTLVEALPGTELIGFYNWTLTRDCDVLEVTDFSDGTARVYIPGFTNWTATAEKHWVTDSGQSQSAWVGGTYTVRFFSLYNASPATTTAYYFEGDAIVTGVNTNTVVDQIVTQALAFQGKDAAISMTTRTTAWP